MLSYIREIQNILMTLFKSADNRHWNFVDGTLAEHACIHLMICRQILYRYKLLPLEQNVKEKYLPIHPCTSARGSTGSYIETPPLHHYVQGRGMWYTSSPTCELP